MLNLSNSVELTYYVQYIFHARSYILNNSVVLYNIYCCTLYYAKSQKSSHHYEANNNYENNFSCS